MIGLTDCVTKLICPNTTFEPMFSTTATPIATRKSSGAIHEVVVRMSRTMMSGTSTSAAADDLAHGQLLHARRAGGVAGNSPALAYDLIEGVRCLYLTPALYRDAEQGLSVLPILLHRGLVHQLDRRSQVRNVVEPHDVCDTRSGGYLFLELERLRYGQVHGHDPRVRDPRTELLQHEVERNLCSPRPRGDSPSGHS